MALSKRLRFEVLRRDGFACTYCGASGATAQLHVDHVQPIALGGDDSPTNLVTACADCNSGKASSTPDAALVASAQEREAQAETNRSLIAARLADIEAAFEQYRDDVYELWDRAVPRLKLALAEPPRAATIRDWFDEAVPLSLVRHAFEVAVESPAQWSNKAAYAVGIVKNKVREAGYATH